MELRTTPVHQCLDRKLTLGGFEIPDLLVIFLTLSILNLFFNETDSKLLLIWLPSLALSGALFFGKRGKPEKYLLHLIRFHLKPRSLSAFLEPSNERDKP